MCLVVAVGSAVFCDAVGVERGSASDSVPGDGLDRGPCSCSLTACGGSWAALSLPNPSGRAVWRGRVLAASGAACGGSLRRCCAALERSGKRALASPRDATLRRPLRRLRPAQGTGRGADRRGSRGGAHWQQSAGSACGSRGRVGRKAGAIGGQNAPRLVRPAHRRGVWICSRALARSGGPQGPTLCAPSASLGRSVGGGQ